MESIDISSTTLLMLLLVGLLSGFIDSVAGGGGLLALPALLFVGLPPQVALGTNKLQGSFGTLSAGWNFISKKQVSLGKAMPGILFTLIGASTGALLVQSLDPAFIEPLTPPRLFLHPFLQATRQERQSRENKAVPVLYSIRTPARFLRRFFRPRNRLILDGGLHVFCRLQHDTGNRLYKDHEFYQ